MRGCCDNGSVDVIISNINLAIPYLDRPGVGVIQANHKLGTYIARGTEGCSDGEGHRLLIIVGVEIDATHTQCDFVRT